MITGKCFTVSVPNCSPPLNTKHLSTVFIHTLRKYTYETFFAENDPQKTSLELLKCIYC